MIPHVFYHLSWIMSCHTTISDGGTQASKAFHFSNTCIPVEWFELLEEFIQISQPGLDPLSRIIVIVETSASISRKDEQRLSNMTGACGGSILYSMSMVAPALPI